MRNPRVQVHMTSVIIHSFRFTVTSDTNPSHCLSSSHFVYKNDMQMLSWLRKIYMHMHIGHMQYSSRIQKTWFWDIQLFCLTVRQEGCHGSLSVKSHSILSIEVMLNMCNVIWNWLNNFYFNSSIHPQKWLHYNKINKQTNKVLLSRKISYVKY